MENKPEAMLYEALTEAEYIERECGGDTRALGDALAEVHQAEKDNDLGKMRKSIADAFDALATIYRA